ncbi:hypothetical protein VP01_1888g3 [Puccinia sorghi]|uniref:Major facilitator superfamily (MFS) profile domain-containing protein n=1 Tax=Puccinia sorghi TaxID=27349 RepID=A0A0L6VD45_9BASI|nr:hypothetical protein VP01_1888g3 [Puccinia sorghi]
MAHWGHPSERGACSFKQPHVSESQTVFGGEKHLTIRFPAPNKIKDVFAGLNLGIGDDTGRVESRLGASSRPEPAVNPLLLVFVVVGPFLQNHTPTPLPFKQIFVLCVMRLTGQARVVHRHLSVHQVRVTTSNSFLLYFNQGKMVEDLDIVARTEVGTYAGLIESESVCAGTILDRYVFPPPPPSKKTVLFWGRLSDRIGRKPVLLSGLMGLSLGIIAFGLQRTFIGLVLARSFAGAMNGNIAVVKVYRRSLSSISLAEITDDSNKARHSHYPFFSLSRAFPLLPLCWALGLMIGPTIGGYTAEAARQYPHSIFNKYTFFSTYPYFIPCFLAGLLNLVALVLGALFLEETLPSKTSKAQKRSSVGFDDENGVENRERFDPVERSPALLDLLTRHVVTLLVSFAFMALENSAWMAIIPLFSYTRVENGGLGLSLDQIGMTLSSNGVVALVVQSIIFPILHRRLGAVHLHRITRLTSPIAFIGLPMVRTISCLFPDRSMATSVSIIGIIIVIAIKGIGNMTIVCMTLLINDSAPNHAALGSLNGLGQSVASFSRAISPFVVGKLFSVSLAAGKTPHPLFFQKDLIWYYLTLVSLVGYSTTWMINTPQKQPPQGQPERQPLLDSTDDTVSGPTSRRGEQEPLITNPESSVQHYGS